MGAADGGDACSGGGGGGEVVDLAQLTAVCSAVVGAYDRVLTGDRSVPPPDLERALAGARGLRGVPGRLGWAIDLVGRGATGATPAELSLAIDTLRRIAPPA